MKRIVMVIMSVALILGCSEDTVTNHDSEVSFEIYLSLDDISAFEPVQLDEVNLAETPLLSLSDITTYNWTKHLITYPESVWNRLKTIDDLHCKEFVVKVDDEPVYWGRFFENNQAFTCTRPVILLLPDTDDTYRIPGAILIEQIWTLRAYKGSEYDLRSDLRIYTALQKAGVLVEEDLPDADIAQNSFAIYVAKDITYDENSIDIDEIPLIETPLLTVSDISCYAWDNHTISYPDSVWKRMGTWDNLLNKYFVVCVGDERIYWGRFTNTIESYYFHTPVVIKLTIQYFEGSNIPGVITIDYCCPFSRPPDPRNDSRIYNALQEVGVLVDLENVYSSVD